MESIYWVISKDCNQRCSHCYNDSRPGGPGLTRDQVSQAVANFPDGTSVPVERVIIGGGEPLVWMDLLLHALSELRARYRERTRLEIQTNGDLLDERAIEQLVTHGLTKISVTAMDPYHAPATLRRRDAIEALLRDSGFVELQEAGERDRLVFDIWGVTEDSWIGALWPRGRALREGLTRATPADRFCSVWSGGKGCLDYLETGSEVNIQLSHVYPCCPMTVRPIGDVLEEPLIPMLDRCARHPAFQAINRGCPEVLGTWMGISEEHAQRRNEALGNLCLWCDEFFAEHAPDLLWQGASRDDDLDAERPSALPAAPSRARRPQARCAVPHGERAAERTCPPGGSIAVPLASPRSEAVVRGRRRREATKARHQRIAEDLARLREFLNAWDPYGLIAGGAPEDEFDSEGAQIYGALTSGAVQSETELGRRIATIFRRAFDASFSPGNCADVAQSIWSWWQERTSD